MLRMTSAPGRRESGQATVELALVIPVLLLLTAAVCQIALGLNCYLVVTQASREGARRGAETNDEGEARSAAVRACRGLPGGDPSVDVEFPEGRSRGKPVRVIVTYRMPVLIPGLSSLVPQARFSRGTSMALERDR